MQRSRSRLAGLLDVGAPAAAAVLYFFAVALFHPLRGAFEIDPDEGIQAMLALLIARGHPLYHEAWTEHGPLLPNLLRIWLDLVGWDVATGRLLILLFAASIVFALYDMVRRATSHLAALAAVLFLCTSAHFVPLGIALMTSLPSIAFAVLAVWALARGARSSRSGWTAAAGLLMSVSLGIKLITAFLLPVIALWVAMLARERGGAHPLGRAALWLFFAIAPTGALLLAFAGMEHLTQLGASASARAALSRYGFLGLGPIALQDWPLVLCAAIGAVQVLRRRAVDLCVWPLWVASALAVLIGYAPVWYHHYLLLSVPASACAGVGLAHAWRSGWWRAWRQRDYARTATGLAAAAAAAWLVATLPRSGKLGPRAAIPSLAQGEQVVAAMRRLGERTRFVVTDAPMFAFRAGLTAVPRIAVISTKRMATGDLTAADVVAAIDRHAPEQILLTGRFTAPIAGPVVEAIRDRYRLVPIGPPGLGISLYAIRETER